MVTAVCVNHAKAHTFTNAPASADNFRSFSANTGGHGFFLVRDINNSSSAPISWVEKTESRNLQRLPNPPTDSREAC